MASGLVKVEGLDKFIKKLQEQVDRQEERIIERFQYIGERAVRHARLHGTYEDQTGNLRSSIGYIILKDGVRIDGSEPKIYEDGEEGAENMMNLLEKIRNDGHHEGLELFLCAGMEYASYVEDYHELDVLTGAKNLVESLVAKMK